MESLESGSLWRRILPIAMILAILPLMVSADSADTVPTTAVAELAMKAAQLLQKVNRLHTEGRHQDALSAGHRAVDLLERAYGSNHSLVGDATLMVGMLLLEMRNYETARYHLERALAIQESQAKRDDLAITYIRVALGSSLKELRALTEAKQHVEQALEIHRAAGSDDAFVAGSLTLLALIYRDMGNLESAKSCLLEALEIQRRLFGDDAPETASGLLALGRILNELGDYAAAKEHLEYSLRIQEKNLGAGHHETARTLNNLGVHYLQQGELKKAQDHLERSLEIAEDFFGPSHLETAEPLGNLAGVFEGMGDLETAKTHSQRALEIYKKDLGPENEKTILSLSNHGLILLRMEEISAATETLRSADKICTKVFGPKHPLTASIAEKLGSALIQAGSTQRAESQYQRALRINERIFGPKDLRLANALNNLGTLALGERRLRSAKKYLKRSLNIHTALLRGDSPNTIAILHNLALAHWNMDNINAAIKTATRAQEMQERWLTPILTMNTEAENQLFFQNIVRSSALMISLHLPSAPSNVRAARLALTTILLLKGRVLDVAAGNWRSTRRHAEPEVQKLLRKRNDLQSRIASLLLRSADIGEMQARIAIANPFQEELQETERLLAKHHTYSQQPTTIQSVQETIPEGTVLLEFFATFLLDVEEQTWGELKPVMPRYVVYIVGRTGEPIGIDLGSKEVIDSASEAFRVAIREKRSDVRQRARDLDALTLAKVRPLLNGPKSLLVSPDGALSLIPFAALVDEEGSYLIENYNLGYLTSGRDLLRTGLDPPSREPPLVLGDADFDASLRPPMRRSDGTRAVDLGSLKLDRLPGTAAEVTAIGKILGIGTTRTLTGLKATETALKSTQGPKILHLATHGFFVPDPTDDPPHPLSHYRDFAGSPEDSLVRSGLALAGFNHWQKASAVDDGVLTALEVAGLDLWGTEVAVLSACETGVGEVRVGEGVFGLRRALVLAGAKTQVMSLWRVADEPTADLMVSWYEQLVRGVPRAQALRQIQLSALRGEPLPITNQRLRGIKLLDTAGTSGSSSADTLHPYYWASFILSGETGPLPISPEKGPVQRAAISSALEKKKAVSIAAFFDESLPWIALRSMLVP